MHGKYPQETLRILKTPRCTSKGCGPVDGYPPYLSSSKGELAGITSIAIISKLLMEFHSTQHKVQISSDNQGVIKKLLAIIQ
jgi:hypothetical protein